MSLLETIVGDTFPENYIHNSDVPNTQLIDVR